jgi:hypothetical protein
LPKTGRPRPFEKQQTLFYTEETVLSQTEKKMGTSAVTASSEPVQFAYTDPAAVLRGGVKAPLDRDPFGPIKEKQFTATTLPKAQGGGLLLQYFVSMPKPGQLGLSAPQDLALIPEWAIQGKARGPGSETWEVTKNARGGLEFKSSQGRSAELSKSGDYVLKDTATTMAVGEENAVSNLKKGRGSDCSPLPMPFPKPAPRQDDGLQITTMAVGEEGGSGKPQKPFIWEMPIFPRFDGNEVTTMAFGLGEGDGGCVRPRPRFPDRCGVGSEGFPNQPLHPKREKPNFGGDNVITTMAFGLGEGDGGCVRPRVRVPDRCGVGADGFPGQSTRPGWYKPWQDQDQNGLRHQLRHLQALIRDILMGMNFFRRDV